MDTTLEEALRVMNRWAEEDRSINVTGDCGMLKLQLKGHLTELTAEKIELFLNDVGMISFDPRKKFIDWSDVRESPENIRQTMTKVYDESLYFRESAKCSLMLSALLETGAK